MLTLGDTIFLIMRSEKYAWLMPRMGKRHRAPQVDWDQAYALDTAYGKAGPPTISEVLHISLCFMNAPFQEVCSRACACHEAWRQNCRCDLVPQESAPWRSCPQAR